MRVLKVEKAVHIDGLKGMRRPRTVSMRSVVDAVLYVARAGCSWRLPPPMHSRRGTVYGSFCVGARRGSGNECTIRCGRGYGKRQAATTGNKGFDAGKKIQGRKRHILVDTFGLLMGLLMALVVTATSVQDRDGAKLLLRTLPGSCTKIRRIWVNGGYRGQWLDWVALRLHFVLDVGWVDGLPGKPCMGAAPWPRRRFAQP